MIRIRMAGLNIGIDNRYPFSVRVHGFETDAEPDFVVSVAESELELEQKLAAGMPSEYLEFVCAYRHIAEKLPEYDAFVMHGAVAALDDREAYLFTAPSGTGKTTHLSLWELRFGDRVRILNGDKPVLRKLDGRFYACGTPWRGKECVGYEAMLPLKGICLLDRGLHNEIRPMSQREALEPLMHQFYMPKEEAHLDRFLTLLGDCLQEIPLFRLTCNRSSSAAAVSFEALTGQPAGHEPELPPKLYERLHRFDGESL